MFERNKTIENGYFNWTDTGQFYSLFIEICNQYPDCDAYLVLNAANTIAAKENPPRKRSDFMSEVLDVMNIPFEKRLQNDNRE